LAVLDLIGGVEKDFIMGMGRYSVSGQTSNRRCRLQLFTGQGAAFAQEKAWIVLDTHTP